MLPMSNLPAQDLAALCERWKVTELSLFGSALRDDVRATSDYDLLVTFDEDAHWTLFDLVRMKAELEALLGRDVDVLTRRGVESSRNATRRQSILDSAEVIYAA